jgi:hypothetical protein
MKIKLDQPIKDFSGKVVEDEKKEPVTFRSVVETALNAQSNEHPLTAEKKLYAFQIGVKLFSKKREEYDLTIEQVSFLKERVGLFFSVVAYGRFLELIGEPVVEKEENEPINTKKSK